MPVNPLQKLAEISTEISSIVNELGVVQRSRHLSLVQSVFALAVEARSAKNYELSDRLREALRCANIEVIQGTGDYKYEDIPEHLKGRPVADTWREIE